MFDVSFSLILNVRILTLFLGAHHCRAIKSRVDLAKALSAQLRDVISTS